MRSPALVVLLACVLIHGSGAPAQQVERRDRKDPELVVESGGRMGTCDCLTFTADGRYVLAAGDDKVVRVWPFREGKLDPRTMTVLRWPIWREQRGAIYALAVSPDREGKRVAIGGRGLLAGNAAVAVLDRASGEVLQMGRPPAQGRENFYAVRAISFAPSGKQVAYGTSDGSIWLWDFTKKTTRKVGRHQPRLGNPINRVWLVHFLDPDRLLSLAADGTLSEWDLRSDAPARKRWTLLEEREPKWPLYRAVVSPDGKWLVAAAERAVVHVRSLDGKQSHDLLLPKGQFPRAIAFDARGRLAVGVGRLVANAKVHLESNDVIRFYDLSKAPPAATEGPPHTYRAEFLAFHPKQPDCLVVAGGDNHEVTQWDLRDTQRPKVVLRGKGTGLWDVALSGDDRYLGIRDQRDPDSIDPNGRARGPWRVFDVEQRDWVPAGKFKPLPRRTTQAGWKVVPDPRDRLVWYAEDPDGKRHRLPLTPNEEMPRCYAFFPRAAGEPVRLAVGHYWGLSVYTLSEQGEDARRTQLCAGHQGEVTALAVSSDGSWLVSASSDQTVVAWDVKGLPSRTELGATFRLREGRLFVESVDLFSPGWEAGLVVDDEVVVLAVGGKKVFDCEGGTDYGPAKGKVQDCLAQLANPTPGRELFFAVRRGKNVRLIPMLTTVRRRPLWRFFPSRPPENEWVLWMPRHNYYDTSTNGDFCVGWHMNNGARLEATPRFYRAEQFRRVFLQPRVIDLLLGSRDPALTLKRAGVSLLPPDFRKLEPHTVGISVSTKVVTDKDLEATVVADPQSDNPDRVPIRTELWVNDHRLQVWKPERKRFAAKATVPRTKLRTGKNLLTFQCYNHVAGRGEGRAEVSVEVNCVRKESRGALHGLAVGIEDYRRSRGPGGAPWPNLPGAWNDAREMEAAWKARSAPLYDNARSVIELLPNKEADASPATIRRRLAAIAARAKPDDVVVLFLGGHGDMVESEGEKLFVFCGPTYDRQDIRGTALTGRDLYEALAAIACRKIILLDVCQAGGLAASPVRDLTPGGVGPTILAACGRGERSYESKKLGRYKGGRGLFSYAITEALDSPSPGENASGEVGPKELFLDVEKRLPLLLRTLKLEGAQNPIHFPVDLDPHPVLVKAPKTRKR